MKRFTAVSPFVILLVLLTAQAGFSAQTNQQRLNLTLKDVSFPEAIRQIFSGSPDSYSVDVALNDLKVSATLKNIVRDQALKVVCRTAGVVYRVENGAYMFSPKPAVVSMPGEGSGYPVDPARLAKPAVVSMPGEGSVPVTMKGPAKVDLITLRYVSAGDAASLLNASPPDGLVSITATSVNTLMLKGDAEAIDQAREVIKLFDVEAALPRPVRVTLSLKASAAGLKNPINLSTQSVGPEGCQIPLGINSSSAQTYSYMLSATLTPTILPDGSISLTGSGAIDCSPPWGGPNAQRVSKSFDVAASVASGTPTVIASGSADSGTEKVEFTISATAVVEKGRVAMPKCGPSPSGGGGTVPAQIGR